LWLRTFYWNEDRDVSGSTNAGLGDINLLGVDTVDSSQTLSIGISALETYVIQQDANTPPGDPVVVDLSLVGLPILTNFVVQNGADLVLSGTVTGTVADSFTIGSDGTLTIGPSVGASVLTSITFEPGSNGTLIFGPPAGGGLADVSALTSISGYSAGDTIEESLPGVGDVNVLNIQTIDTSQTLSAGISALDTYVIEKDAGTPTGDPVVVDTSLAAVPVGTNFLVQNGADLELNGTVTGAVDGNYVIGNNGTLTIDPTVNASVLNNISFSGTTGTLIIGEPDGSSPVDISALGTISGVGPGDTIEINGYTYTGGETYNNGTLSMPVVGGTINMGLLLDGTGLTGTDITVNAAGPNGIMVTVACFAEGTRIATENGSVPVELLRPGQRVTLAGGGTRDVVWTGHRDIDIARHPRPHDVQPVRIMADAFAPGQPAVDVRLSPDHAVFVDGVLIPIRYLLNGRTIVQENVARVCYWHVELDRHDVLLAEGLPAESYLDTGNRNSFEEAPVTSLHANFAPVAMEVWDQDACARLVTSGVELEAARSFLAARAEHLGHLVTQDPGLHLLADGVLVAPSSRRGNRIHFALRRPCRSLRLVSRAAVPAHVADSNPDHRRLGICVTALSIDGVRLDLAALDEGWHDLEPRADGAWRWTDGDAALPLGGRTVAVEMQPLSLGYVVAPIERSAGRAAA
jgi:hypothetical protein